MPRLHNSPIQHEGQNTNCSNAGSCWCYWSHSSAILKCPHFNQCLHSFGKKKSKKKTVRLRFANWGPVALGLYCWFSLLAQKFSVSIQLFKVSSTVIWHKDITNAKQKYFKRSIFSACHIPASYKCSKLTKFLHKFSYIQLRP